MNDRSGQVHEFQFGGSGWEYFRIWIVNLLLTVLTLGIYSAWAKVRRLQYFYRNTRLAGAGFDYHGSPKAILRGRIIAATLFTAYNTAFKVSPPIGMAVGMMLAVVMPWLLMRSLRFKLYNSSYRGLRFGFAGSTKGAYSAFLGYPALAALSLYLLAPLAHQRIKRYQFSNSRLGLTDFNFNASVSMFYGIYLVAVAIMGGAGLLAFAVFQTAKELHSGAPVIVAFLLVAVAFLFVGTMFAAFMQNMTWNNTAVGGHMLFSNISARRLLWIMFTNVIGVALTAGLYKPFAAVRLLRYRIESMGLVANGELTDFVAGQQQEVSASGEETAEMFDVDISF